MFVCVCSSICICKHVHCVYTYIHVHVCTCIHCMHVHSVCVCVCVRMNETYRAVGADEATHVLHEAKYRQFRLPTKRHFSSHV